MSSRGYLHIVLIVTIGVIALALVVAVGYYKVRVLSEESADTPSSTTNSRRSNGNVNTAANANAPTNTTTDSTVRAVKPSLIYATKDGTHVTVQQQNTQTGTEQTIFEYDERRSADTSGNYWSGLPPSIALSPDGDDLLYVAADGVKVYHRDTATTEDLITVVQEGGGELEDRPPTWSVDAITGTYGFANPAWSSDGSHISLSQSLYEGSLAAIVDGENSTLIHPTCGNCPEQTGIGSVQHRLRWSPVENRYIAPLGDGYAIMGLHRSDANAGQDTTNLLPPDEASFAANFSPDGSKLVFTHSRTTPNAPDASTVASVSDLEGIVLASFDTPGTIMDAVFTPDGKSIVLVDVIGDDVTLRAYPASGGDGEVLVSFATGFNNLDRIDRTTDNAISVTSTRSSDDTRRLYLIDPDEGTIVYETPATTRFTIFAGFVE